MPYENHPKPQHRDRSRPGALLTVSAPGLNTNSKSSANAKPGSISKVGSAVILKFSVMMPECTLFRQPARNLLLHTHGLVDREVVNG